MKRILTALIGLPILLFAIWSSIPYFFAGLTALAVLIALAEFYNLATKVNCRVISVPGYLAALAIVGCFTFNQVQWIVCALAVLAMFTLGVALTRVDDIARAIVSVSVTVFGVVYVAVLAGSLVGVRILDDTSTRARVPNLAAKLITIFFVIVFMSDTAAYYCGRSFGRHKLAPLISPGKTIEGSIGGWIGAVVAAAVCKLTFFRELSLIDALLLGATIGIVGQVGDLAESMLKRSADVKDSGTLLPGHGGVLDRIDSILFCAPLLYYYSQHFVSTH